MILKLKNRIRSLCTYNKVLIVGTLLLLPMLACNKKLDINSTHLVNETNNWQTISDTRAALLGTYGLLRSALADNNAHWLYGELRSGDFEASSRQDLKAIITNKLNAPYPVVKSLSDWRKFYAIINSASIFIERSGEVLTKDRQYTERNHKVDVAQMRAIRAFTYFLMCRIWGDVPLITSSHDSFFDKKARTSQSIVLRYAESELLAVLADLPYRYGMTNDADLPGPYYDKFSDGITTPNDLGYWNGVLLTKISAYAILAHIAAWDQRYLDASTYADFVLRNYSRSGATYTTSLNLTLSDGLFYSNTPSSANNNSASHLVGIPFKWSNMEISQVGHIEDLTLAAPLITRSRPQIYIPDSRITTIFNEANDDRFHIDPIEGTAVTGYFTGYGTANTIFSKIKCIRNAPQIDGSLALYSSAIVFTRIEEMALLYAESMAALGNYGAAIDELDRVRQLRGLSAFSGNNNEVIDAIFTERRRELMGEGWRWFDQVRYNRIKRNNPVFNQLLDNGGVYWPVSEEALRNNSLLTQNDYWK